MDTNRLVDFIENSFLKDLLIQKDITDISYNGDSVFYQHNELGRKKSDIKISELNVRDFIRQIANLSEKQFSYQCPCLDVSVSKYRINAIHHSIGRAEDRNSVTFTIRIASEEIRIKQNSDFMPKPIEELVEVLIKSKQSIVIGGVTGTGKTEFQKYILSKMPVNERVIIIDNVLELDRVRINKDIDINSWQVDEKNEYANIQFLVKNALRSNPDWLIVAESRGKEMLEILNSAMTGHPIITTVHALDVESIPHRLCRMVMMNEQRLEFNNVIGDINYHFHFYFYLKIEEKDDGSLHRYIDKVAVMGAKGKMKVIYDYSNKDHKYKKLSKTFTDLLIFDGYEQFKECFINEE